MAEPTPLNQLTSRAGASYEEQAGWLVPAHYGDALAEYRTAFEGAVIFDQSDRGKLEVSGTDAATFLHNLCTNSVTDMPIGAGCEAFFTDRTAKILAHASIYHVLLGDNREAFWLDTPPGLGEKLIKHMDRHLISEAVEFADRTREFAQVHLAGPRAKQVLEAALFDEVPELEPLQHMVRTFGTSANAHIRRNDPLALRGYDIMCLNRVAALVWDLLLRAGARPAGTQAFEMLRVEAGLPIYGRDMDETRFVVEVGRVAQAISYQKGCYLGQEPIVMARDRGQVQRTLLGLKLAGKEPVPPGSKIWREGKEVGLITSSVLSPRLEQAVALAYLRRGHQDPGTAVEVETASVRVPAEVTTLPVPGTRD